MDEFHAIEHAQLLKQAENMIYGGERLDRP
jgi:hypothetical protein